MSIEAEFLSPLGKNALRFSQLHAREALGRLPEFQLKLLRERKDGKDDKQPVKAKDLLGLNAALRIEHEKQDRFIHGVVTRFQRGGTIGDFDVYRVDLRPWLWHLTLGQDCRVFQDKTAVEIIEAVFKEYSSAGAVSKKLSGSFVKRPYTVQYRESDFDFVTRLMEEEGIYYYFTYTETNHTLVLCNGPGGHSPMPGGTLEWRPREGRLRVDTVDEWVRSHALRPVKFVHTDFAAEKPGESLLASAERKSPYPTPTPRGYEVFEYPGGHDDLAMLDGQTGAKVDEGKRIAAFRVDAFESGHSVAAAVTRERRLTIGTTFSLKGHPEDDGKYLVTDAVYWMEFKGYDTRPDRLEKEYGCQFEAVPEAVKFQPERSRRQPLTMGPQTATVVGTQGKEIDTDVHGRVKVQFHWDRLGTRDEKSSCWLRVSQPWAGKGFGFIALPRIGDEVVVGFLDGDPDRPLITGRVYNGDNPTPYELPAQATVSGLRTRSSLKGGETNFNELRFDDKKGSEYVWFQAEKDYHHWVKNDAKVTIEGLRKQLVKKDDQLKVDGKLDGEVAKTVTLKIGEDTHGSVGGDLLLKVGGATGLKVVGATQVDSGGAMKLSTGAALDVAAASGIKLGTDTAVHIKANTGVMIDGGMSLTIKAGSGYIVLDAGGVSIVGPIVKINSGGSASPAQQAQKPQVPAPKDPPALPEHKDPMPAKKKS